MIQIKSLAETQIERKLDELDTRLERVEEDIAGLEKVVKVLAGVLTKLATQQEEKKDYDTHTG